MPTATQPQRDLFDKIDKLGYLKTQKISTAIRSGISNIIGSILITMNDLTMLGLSLSLAYLTRHYVLPYFYPVYFKPVRLDLLFSLWWFPVLCLIVLAYEGLYHKRLTFWREVKSIIKALTYSVGIAALVLFLTKSATSVSRPIITLAYIYAILIIPVSRYFTKSFILKLGLWQKPVIILGAGKTAELVIRGFYQEVTMGYQPVGILEDNTQKKKGILCGKVFVPVIGRFDDVEQVMDRTGIRNIVIAAPGLENKQLVDLTNRLQQISANVMLVPDLFGIPLSGISLNYFFDEKTLLLSIHNNLASLWNRSLKRIFDIVFGSIMLIACLPLMAIITVAIKIDSKGPVIFTHSRIGKQGKSFNCLKFRTMVVNSQEVLENLLASNPEIRKEWERDFKLKNDPRITRVGNFLRRTSLDELPQLFNVLAGQMSLVGPRPIVNDEIKKYGKYFADFMMVLPGITGLWQVSGRNDIDYEERVQLDVWYVRNWSLWLDIIILIRTIGVVVNRKGAY